MNLFKFLFIVFLLSACMNKDLFNPDKKQTDEPNNEDETYTPFKYAYDTEIKNPEAEIIIELKSTNLPNINNIKAAIPHLKYNKTMLFMLTQDDCKHSSFCRTWAAINGKPITRSNTTERNYYYDIEHLMLKDMPPDTYTLGKTLASTDGNGNDVRFHFTTTIAPEWDFMKAKTVINKNYTNDYYRFYMKSGLRWNNVIEMLNYGTGIAIHDVNTTSIQNVDSIYKHLEISQNKTKEALNGRAFKMMAEPNGNKTYIQAALRFNDLKTITAQSGAQKLYPYKLEVDLDKLILERTFFSSLSQAKLLVNNQINKNPEDREAVHIGIHESADDLVEYLLWLNNTYGKDGQDNLWFPSQEEYYEYNFNRNNSIIEITPLNNKLNLKIKFPLGTNMYHPSLTINLPNLALENIASISSNDIVKGLTYGKFENGTTITIDCRKHLYERAKYYTDLYLKNKNDSNLKDALYFINNLKESAEKTKLKNSIQN